MDTEVFELKHGNCFEYFKSRDEAVSRGHYLFPQAKARFGDGGSAILFCGDAELAIVIFIGEGEIVWNDGSKDFKSDAIVVVNGIPLYWNAFYGWFSHITGGPHQERTVGAKIIKAARDLSDKRIGFKQFRNIIESLPEESARKYYSCCDDADCWIVAKHERDEKWFIDYICHDPDHWQPNCQVHHCGSYEESIALQKELNS